VAISVGSVSVDVVPDARRFVPDLRAKLNNLPAVQLPVQAATQAASAAIDKVAKAPRTATVNVTAETSKAKADVDALQKQIRDKSLRLNVDTADAKAKLAQLQSDIAQAKAAVKLNADDTEAKAKLAALKKEASDLRGQIDLDTAPARAEIAKLKAEANRGKVTVQAEADTARAEAELARLAGNRTANIRVDDSGSILSATNRLGALLTAGVALGPAIVPAAAAAAAAVGAIGVGALAGVAGIGTLVLGFSGVGDAVKALGAAQTSAGRDAAKSAASQVAAAEQIRSAEASLANVRANSGDSAVRSARAVADAQQGVRDATREAARSVQDALAAQATAQRGVEDAARSAATSVRNALRQQVDAQRAVEDATRSATRSVADALFAQENAEQSLAQAQRDARTAQLSLTQAREDARQSLEDLTLQVEDGALAQRRAVLGVQEAQAALNDVMVDPKATQRQRDLAQLAYDEAAQNLEQIGVRNRRLAAEKAAADKAGIEGSRQVQAATAGIATAEQRVEDARTQAARAADAVSEARRAGDERVMVAQQRLADSTVAIAEAQRAGEERVAAARAQLAKAEQGVADARVAADRRVADAQARVSEAVASQAQQQRASAFAISQAQAAVASAHRQAATAAEAQSASLTKVDDAMKALTPAGRTFALFLFSLRHRFDELKATAQEGLLPGVQQGIQAVLPLLPVLNRIVGNAAQAMGDLFAQAGKALTSPFWQDFFNMIATTVGPNLKMFGGLLLNLGQGFAGLLMAFQPLNAQLGAGLLNLSQRFAEFGAGASKSGGFQAFIAYVQQVGPQIIATIRSVATTIGRIVVALAPIGPIVLQSIGFLADVINRVPIDVLRVLAVAIGGLVIGFRLFSAAVWLVNIAMNANPLSLIVIGLVALGAALVIAYQHSETFRNVVNAAWAGIKAAAAATWTFLQGVFSTLGGWLDGIKTAFTAFSGVVSSVWDGVKNAISTAWGFIVGVFNAIVGFLSGPLHTAFSIWRQIVQTEFEIVRAVIVVAWAIISKIFSAIVGWVRDTITTAFRNFKTNITAIWNAVAGAIQYAWDKWFHPVFKAIGDWVGPKLKTAFDNAKTNLTAIWNAIAGVIQFAWDKWFHPVFKAISDWVGPKLKTAFDNAKTNLTRIWNGIAGVVKDAWDKVIKPAFKAVKDAITDGVPKAFESGVAAIKTAWDKIKGYAKAPVRFVIETVLNHGILAAFNSVAEKVLDTAGAKKIHINSIPLPKGFARGTEDHRAQIAHPNQPRLWAEPETGGEAYIPLAPSKRPRSARILRDVAERFGYGLIRMANGGTLITAGRHLRDLGYDVTEGPGEFGPVHHVHAPGSRHYDLMALDINHGAGTSKVEQAALSKIVPYLQGLGLRIIFMAPGHYNHLHAEVPRAKGLGSQIGGLVKGAAGAVADFLDPRQLIMGPLNSLLSKIPGRDSTFGKIVAGAPKSIATMLINKAKEFVGLGSGDTKDFSGGGGAEFGGSGTARWRGIVTQVVAQLGQPASAVDAVLRRIQFESGGNPHAVNLTDSNARAGHPSQGLMQVIPGTFNAYAGPYMARGIRDPLANIYAGANYALHRYHSLAAIDPRNRPRGYDAGGFLQPGLTTVYNGTGKPEPVFTAEQFAAMRQGMGARTGVVIQGDVHTASVDEFAREMGARQRLDEALHPLFA
jgi:phage-related protein